MTLRKEGKGSFYGLPVIGIVSQKYGDILGIQNPTQTSIVGGKCELDAVLVISLVKSPIERSKVIDSGFDVVVGTFSLIQAELSNQFGLSRRHDLHQPIGSPIAQCGRKET